MQNEVMVKQTVNLPAVSAETTALLSMIERVCLDPNADIDKLSKMLDMQERILNRNAEQAFAADFAAMQSELPRIARNGTIKIKKDGRLIQSTPFAKLEDINDGVRPTLQKYGFGVSFSIEQSGGLITVTATLLHRLGHSKSTSMSLPIDSSGSKNAVQGNGSSVSYGKRYTMSALLNISTGDDVDGHSAAQDDNQPQQQPQYHAPKEKPPISNAGLNESMAKIKTGELTIQRLRDNRQFTPEQQKAIDEWVAGAEWVNMGVSQ